MTDVPEQVSAAEYGLPEENTRGKRIGIVVKVK